MAFPWFYFSQIGNGGVLAIGTEDLGFLHGAGGSSCRWPFLGPGDDESMRILRRFLRDGIAMDPNDPYMAG